MVQGQHTARIRCLAGLSLVRGVWLHANLLRSDGDEWRARGAAEALLREAEQDLLASFAAAKDARHSLRRNLLGVLVRKALTFARASVLRA